MRHETIKLYEGREDVTLTSYVLNDSNEQLKGGPRPAIIICPGGAYMMCSSREGEPIALGFNAMGYNAFVVNYSVYNKGVMINPMEQELLPDEDSIYPAAMCDLAAAVLYVKDHAKEYFVDTEKIVVAGFSAGAHNAAMYATSWDGKILSDKFNRTAEDFKVAGAILGYGYYDWEVFRSKKETHPLNILMAQSSDLAFFGVKKPTVEQYRECSPALHVTENTPPMFLWNTSEDQLLPPEQTLLMGVALARAGIPYELHTFEKGEHGLANANEVSAAYEDQVMDDVAQWMPMVQNWLRRHVPIVFPEKEIFHF